MKKFLIVLFAATAFSVAAQSEVGARIQVYPAGVMSTLQHTSFTSDTRAWSIKLGYNTADRQDFGVHDNEEGGGYGFGTDFRRYLKPGHKGFYGEVGLEFWFLKIRWRDEAPTPLSGRTKIAVLQPTIGAGYQLRSKNENWAATLGVAFGREWNISTQGAEVGQGGISLLTFSVTRRL